MLHIADMNDLVGYVEPMVNTSGRFSPRSENRATKRIKPLRNAFGSRTNVEAQVRTARFLVNN
jgi:hypothetical protein